MAKKSPSTPQPIQQLTEYLFARREPILNNWRTRCSADADLHTRTSFSREEFTDQAPVLLNIFNQRLLGQEAESAPVDRAGQHGLHRWQRGYSFRELLNELNHLYLTLTDEFEQYLTLYPQTPAHVMLFANQQLIRLITEVNVGSIMYYDDLRQTTAAEQVQTLQLALDQLHQLTNRRSQHLRETTHDLRGNFGIINSAAHLLKLPTGEEERQLFLAMLSRNMDTALSLLEQLADYARLEAGQEQLTIKAFDAAELVQDVVNGAQHLAKERNLVLQADGPPQLPVVSDPLKVQRIVQNLLMNALKFTTSGWISVSWAAENDTRWLISIQDTGTGLHEGPVAMLAEQLKPLSEPTSIHQPGGPEDYPSQATPATHAHQQERSQPNGEGIGLFVVKRLCQLLKASMDIETVPSHGTMIRIRLLTDQTKSEHDTTGV
ncbi:hypothetical protein GCM10028819_10210 [Spirosoma humi]